MVKYKLLDKFADVVAYQIFSGQTDAKNSSQLKKYFGNTYPPAFFEQQMHGTDFIIVDSENNLPAKGDILITKQTQIPLVIRIADCASVLLFEPNQKIIANIHAGWKGISKRAISKTIHTLATRLTARPAGSPATSPADPAARATDVTATRPADLIACISPMIGPCCSEFSDPKKELPKFMHKYINEENHVDLWAAVEGQLMESGILKSNIENPRICTFCNPEIYPSFRRDGESSGRFETAIMLR